MMALTSVRAQVGEYRNIFSVGVNGGMTMSSVGFVPKVTQSQLIGASGGLSWRYTSERYFKMICSIAGEVNYAQTGWRENIVDIHTVPVVGDNGEAEKYERRMRYVQVPIMAHLAWGKESKGCQFFFQAGPQFGYLMSESTSTNFTPENANLGDRANTTHAQYTMPVENTLDYGICAGLGLEYVSAKAGRYLIEGRYYYGLGNIYGSSKKDFFAKSNQSVIELKLSYLFDITK